MMGGSDREARPPITVHGLFLLSR